MSELIWMTAISYFAGGMYMYRWRSENEIEAKRNEKETKMKDGTLFPSTNVRASDLCNEGFIIHSLSVDRAVIRCTEVYSVCSVYKEPPLAFLLKYIKCANAARQKKHSIFSTAAASSLSLAAQLIGMRATPSLPIAAVRSQQRFLDGDFSNIVPFSLMQLMFNWITCANMNFAH